MTDTPRTSNYRYIAERLRAIARGVYNTNAFRAGQIDDIADEIESLSGGNPGEKSGGLHSDHPGITQARSSEGENGGTSVPGVSIQSREPVDSNPVSGGAGSSKVMKPTSDDPAPVVTAPEPPAALNSLIDDLTRAAREAEAHRGAWEVERLDKARDAIRKAFGQASALRDALDAIASPSEAKDYGWWTQVARRALGVATRNETAQPPPAALDRYDIEMEGDICGAVMQHKLRPNGEWVRYEDVAPYLRPAQPPLKAQGGGNAQE